MSSLKPSPLAPKSPTKITLLDLDRVPFDPECGSSNNESKPSVETKLADRQTSTWIRTIKNVENEQNLSCFMFFLNWIWNCGKFKIWYKLRWVLKEFVENLTEVYCVKARK